MMQPTMEADIESEKPSLNVVGPKTPRAENQITIIKERELGVLTQCSNATIALNVTQLM